MIRFVRLIDVQPNPFQPRQAIDPNSVTDLAANILASYSVSPDTFGLLQVPRARQVENGVQLAFGHRRLAAFWTLSQSGHREYDQFPVELADMTDADMAIAAWSENTERLDINPMEEARLLHRMMDEFGWSYSETARRVGMNRATFSNIIRLNRLPADVQDMVASGQIPRARAITLVALVDSVNEAELHKLANAGAKAGNSAWNRELDQAHARTERGTELTTMVIEPAAAALASALQADDPGAWLVVARAIDGKIEGIDSAQALAQLIIDRATIRARTTHDGRKRVNAMFELAGLDTPWNAAATAKVSEFLAWRQKRTSGRRRSA